MPAASTYGATSRTACAAARSAAARHRRRSPRPRCAASTTPPCSYRSGQTLGRGADNDVVLSYSSVSRRHARVVRDESGFRIEDLDSFNPLMPLDGYQALTDALRVPRLREEASAYFRKGLWTDLRAGRRPGPRQAGMAAYGLAVIVGTYGFLVLALHAAGLAHGSLTPDCVVLAPAAPPCSPRRC